MTKRPADLMNLIERILHWLIPLGNLEFESAELKILNGAIKRLLKSEGDFNREDCEGIVKEFGDWLRFYRTFFPERYLPYAQSFLNTCIVKEFLRELGILYGYILWEEGEVLLGEDNLPSSLFEEGHVRREGKAWEKGRVWLLNHRNALDNFGKFVADLDTQFMDTLNEGDKIKPLFDFFIIHQGIIDEIKRLDAEKRTSRFEEGWVRLRKKVRWLVVDTGRGRPDQAVNDCLRWVEYSNLADCLVQRAAAKLDLAHLLFALQAEFPKGEGT